MTDGAGDRYSIRIGGDASGPVVAGHDIHIETARSEPSAARVDEPSGDTQTNTAEDHATVYAVMDGEQHIHHHHPRAHPHAHEDGPEPTG
ncbi:hypothetical protein [Embleya hyalina]|uniref:Uncharacterized protein n=1 Tax=Embleya hyalina TaxID=516124 RepID=A0A401YEQ6_9ACTN|nr:hypothetical protein [Embleya hyalina]GCD93091.1 hypothetical protein EHYA_00734 [Embleya hyalina]